MIRHHIEPSAIGGTLRWETGLASLLKVKDSIEFGPVLPAGAETPCMLDPEKWFSDVAAEQEEAKIECIFACEFKSTCEEWILRYEATRADGHRHGIWAGLTPQDRINLTQGEQA